MSTEHFPRRAAGSEPPASPGQHRLWFLHQLDPRSSRYNVPLALRWPHRVDPDLLGRSLAEIVRRHEVLRTGFQPTDRLPRLVVASPEPIEVPVRQVPDSTTLAEAARAITAEPFDLAAPPLLRATVLRPASEAEDDVVVLAVHHIAFDGLSVDVFCRELSILYAAYGAGRGSPLSELPVQYADYAAWQQERLAAGGFVADLEFWRRTLADAPVRSGLPTSHDDHGAGAGSSSGHRGAVLRFNPDAATTSAVRAAGADAGLTPFMTFLTAFAVLLSRYGAQSDLVVGIPVAGRGHPDLNGLIGFFTNTVAVRIDAAPAATGAELFGRVKEACLAAYAHQDVPFDAVVDHTRPRREPGTNPLFQVFFSTLSADVPGASEARAERFQPARLGLDLQAAPFDLALHVDAGGTEAFCAFEYDTTMFDPATVQRFADAYLTILTELAADPGRRVQQLLAAPELVVVPHRSVNVAQPDRSHDVTNTAPDLAAGIADIWSAVLGGIPVGPHDGFFDLGGNSLLLVEARALVHARLGVEPTLVELYEHPTPAALAVFLERSRQARPEPRHQASADSESDAESDSTSDPASGPASGPESMAGRRARLAAAAANREKNR